MTEKETGNEGWVKLYRKIQRSSVFQNEGLLKVWIWYLVKANHEDRWISISTGRGKTEVLVKRGQFIFGRKTAAKTLNMDENTLYKRMKKLENMENCNIQSNTHYSIVTILNYDLYQESEKDEVTGIVTPKYHASNRQVTQTRINKNYENHKNKYSPDGVEMKISFLLLSLIRKNKPDFRESDLQKWSHEIGLMITKEKRTPERIEEVIRWATNDEFWKTNILSGRKLPEKFDTLEIKMEAQKRRNGIEGDDPIDRRARLIFGRKEI